MLRPLIDHLVLGHVQNRDQNRVQNRDQNHIQSHSLDLEVVAAQIRVKAIAANPSLPEVNFVILVVLPPKKRH